MEDAFFNCSAGKGRKKKLGVCKQAKTPDFMVIRTSDMDGLDQHFDIIGMTQVLTLSNEISGITIGKQATDSSRNFEILGGIVTIHTDNIVLLAHQSI